jgi:hypothetical protein
MATVCMIALCLLILILSNPVHSTDQERLSGKALKVRLQERGLVCHGCVDKGDALAVLRAHSRSVVSNLTAIASDGEEQLLSDYQVETKNRMHIEDGTYYIGDKHVCEVRGNGTTCVVLERASISSS